MGEEKQKPSIEAFLAETVDVIDEFKNKTQITRIDRMTELYVKNSFDFHINGWGVFNDADPEINPYRTFGLTMDEALELIRYESFILGLVYIVDPENMEVWMKTNIFDKMEAIVKTKREEVIEMLKSPVANQTESETTENQDNTNDSKNKDDGNKA